MHFKNNRIQYIYNIIKNKKMSFKITKNTMLLGIAVIAILIVGVLIVADNKSFKIPGFGPSDEEIAKTAIEYLNKNVLSGQTAILEETSQASGLIKVKIKIGENEYDSYISKDGKLLFAEAIEIKADTTAGEDTNTEGTQTCESLEKTDTPQLEAFVVSRCPFGLQMQRMIAEAIKGAPELASKIKVRYMGAITNGKITAMHGDAEAQENLRQICIREEQPTKYWSYVSCQMKSAGKEVSCEKSTGVDSAKLKSCISDSKRGLAFAQADFTLSDSYKVTGSPTLILNGKTIEEFDADSKPIFGGRTADEMRQIICCASKTEAGFCATKLNTASAASSFSETYSSTGGTANDSANCAPAQ